MEGAVSVLRIRGGRPLTGSVEIPGSKNASLALLSAILLGSKPSRLTNLPEITDVEVKAHLLERFGADVQVEGDHVLVDPSKIRHAEADDRFRLIRTSFYMLGPLLARIGYARMPAPGGCKIGARPLDFHLRGLEMMGASIELENGFYVARTDGLKGAEIYLDFPSAGATQHLMSTATLADGITVIQNAACEPEVCALARFLNAMGARIEGAGTPTITVVGVTRLEGTEFRIPADRLQAGTYLLGAAMTQGDVTVQGILPEEQIALMNKLREAGADVQEGSDWVRVSASQRLKPIRVKTMPHPGFHTDLQQPMCALLTTADGTSVIEETIYESRIGQVPELVRMGAKIRVEGRSMVITGVRSLKGARVDATDLRAGAALCLAGCAAEGETIVGNLHFVDRGYQDIEGKLSSLGADITRIRISDTKTARSADVV
ncbi:MAG: UDP-N-acetylglucosamine 1-carboxyvinyltransferase [Fimbriimonadaceae bacterium]